MPRCSLKKNEAFTVALNCATSFHEANPGVTAKTKKDIHSIPPLMQRIRTPKDFFLTGQQLIMSKALPFLTSEKKVTSGGLQCKYTKKYGEYVKLHDFHIKT
jgi:hypothetical protein